MTGKTTTTPYKVFIVVVSTEVILKARKNSEEDEETSDNPCLLFGTVFLQWMDRMDLKLEGTREGTFRRQQIWERKRSPRDSKTWKLFFFSKRTDNTEIERLLLPWTEAFPKKDVALQGMHRRENPLQNDKEPLLSMASQNWTARNFGADTLKDVSQRREASKQRRSCSLT